MEHEISNKQLRSFGLTVGGVFAIIAFWPLFFAHERPREWAMVITGLLVLPALVFPSSLSWIYKQWMLLGNILGWCNTRIILGGVFYLVVTPIGIIRRMLGNDPMGKQFRAEIDTYRVYRDPRPSDHLKRQF
jgi:hypothetical protein